MEACTGACPQGHARNALLLNTHDQLRVFLREFVLGRNETGLVIGNASAIGGENATLSNDILPGGNLLYYGSATTAGTTTIPLATQQSWASFIATATATGNASAQTGGSSSSAASLAIPSSGIAGIMAMAFMLMML